ncbi:MAG: acyl-CoA dehydrogenase, partial [Promethearchaeota archaeon]
WRVQGKALTAKKGDPQTPIINHPDIRRMLLMQKCYTEGGLALCFHATDISDKMLNAQTDEERNDLYNYFELLTPIVKSFPSEWCLEANRLAIQVLGGAGYVRLHPVECFYRNNRINDIHEGSRGVQAIDLLGRKVARSDGTELKILSTRIKETCAQAEKFEAIGSMGEELMRRLDQVLNVTEKLLEIARQGKKVEFLADSTAYLDMMGHLIVGWLWLDMSVTAVNKLNEDSSDADFLNGKVMQIS